MSTVNLKYSANRPKTDPEDVPVIIIGLAKNLATIGFSDVQFALKNSVSEQDWKTGVATIESSSSETVHLFKNRALLGRLPSNCSRHNAPSRAHAITKLVKSFSTGKSERVVLVCDRDDVYASGCAVARAFSLYSRKTSSSLLAPEGVNGDEKRSDAEVAIEFVLADGGRIAASELSALEHAKTGIQLAARIVDTPCSVMHTDQFVSEVKEVAKALKLKPPLVIQGRELEKKGFGGIYGVGKAAVHQPALVVMSHEPSGATSTVAWVGKGIVYDTGGLSIKGKTSMPGMKRDCGGAAGILGGFYAAVRQGFEQNLHAVFCLAENAVGERSTRPDDIHTLYSGRTVEINNTDAEGRLVVSDGVVYADRDLKADVILDMCTLTGAQGIATGRYHAAHLTNDHEWEQKAARAGKRSGDLSFPLVYCPELHFQEFSSAVADMKNSVADRNNGQPSCAGLFINAHLGFDFPGAWIHVDMASPVHNGERATGYGVALLNVLFGQHINCPMLKKLGQEEEEVEDVSEVQNSKKMRLE